MAKVSLGPARVDICGLVENDSWALALALTSGSSAYNLTGLVAEAVLKSGERVFPLTVTVTDASGGLLTVSQSSAPSIPSGTWALRVGQRTLLQGTVSGQPDLMQ